MLMSAGQEGLWLAHQLDPQSPAYNVVLAVRIRSPLDTGALGRALTDLVERHELLRSRFPAEGDGPDGQPVRRVVPAHLVRLDVREVPGADEDTLFDLARRAGEEPFLLASEGAFRAVLLRRAPEDAVLLTATHHIVSDATSQWILVRDLLHAYEAAVAGTRPDWAPLAVTWDEHVAAGHALAGSPRGRRAADHWEGVFADVPPGTLPADRPRPALRTFNGATHQMRLDAGDAARLREAARDSRLTPFAWLLGAFQAALHRSGSGPRFLIGCPATTRLQPGTREAVGYYVNVLPVTAAIGPSTSLEELAHSAHRQLLHGMAHIAYPLELLGRGELFRVSFTSVAADRLPVPGLFQGPVEHRGLRLELCDVPQQEGQLDLTVEVLESAAGFTALLRYNTDLFDAATVERFADTYARLLRAGLDDPAAPVAAAPLVDADAMAFLLALGTGGA